MGYAHVSHKLRKLAQRENFLPEEGDIKLLAEVITLNKKGENIGIFTQDKDFTLFANPLKEKFGIDIFGF